MDRTQVIIESRRLRKYIYETLGKMHDDVYTPLIGPQFMGGYAWPAGRPQFDVIYGEESTLFITDGLSDCFENEELDPDLKFNGFGIEFYMEFEGKVKFEAFHGHYSLGVLSQISQITIQHGNINGMLEARGIGSIEFANGSFSKDYQDKKGSYGILMNVPSENVPKEMKLNKENVLLVSCRLITRKELDKCRKDDQKDTNKKKLAEQFIQNKSYCYSPFKI